MLKRKILKSVKRYIIQSNKANRTQYLTRKYVSQKTMKQHLHNSERKGKKEKVDKTEKTGLFQTKTDIIHQQTCTTKNECLPVEERTEKRKQNCYQMDT